MSKRKHNFYAVKIGKQPGIYKTWDECKEQVSGYSGALYKGFKTEGEAKDYLSGDLSIGSTVKCVDENDKVDVTIYVDGSFDENTGVYGYGVVAIFKDGTIKEFYGANNDADTARIRNVAGEMLGAMFAVKYARNKKCKSVKLCHDYVGIERWAKDYWKTRNRFTAGYADFMKKNEKELDVYFEKVDAHTGVEYNERADQLAKYAVNNFGRNGARHD